MRKINKPKTLPGILKSESCIQHRKALIENRKKIITNSSIAKIDTNSNYYRGSEVDTNSVLYHLYKLYKNRCAYCEEKRSNLDIEHYRPKNQVEDDTSYPGYFWLAYEWQNLILGCKECNRDAKGVKFKISPTRSKIDYTKLPSNNRKKKFYDLEELKIQEQPLLINPEESGFKPENYFKIELNGKPVGIDSEGRGNETITICALDRGDVNERRQEIIDNVRKFIGIHLKYLNTDESNKEMIIAHVAETLKEIMIEDDDRVHSMVHRLMYIDFDKLIKNEFDPVYHDIIEKAYAERFKNVFI